MRQTRRGSVALRPLFPPFRLTLLRIPGPQLCNNIMGLGRSGLDFCASRCSLLQCGSDTAALLGRFLPRLGPLATRKRPLFLALAVRAFFLGFSIRNHSAAAAR